MAIESITRVSTSSFGVEANGWSWRPVFSPDSRKVGFDSTASNLVPNDTNDVTDIFVKDLDTGAIERISTATDGTQGNDHSSSLVFSADGSRIAFGSWASNLIPGDANFMSDVFVKDFSSGALTLVSTDADGNQADFYSYFPVFSPDGGKIAFSSIASNLVPGDTNGSDDVFVKDLGSGAIERTSTAADGTQGNSWSGSPIFSPDGGRIAFPSEASNLVPGDSNGVIDIFVKNLSTREIALVSTDAHGAQGNGDSSSPVFSPDGSRIAFQSYASNLVPGDTNTVADVFVKDLRTEAIERISTAADGTQGNGGSFSPVFSPDGSRIAFESYADNLVPGDANNASDIFIKVLGTGAISLVSIGADGAQGNYGSSFPVFSPDGSHIAFLSDASNLVPGDTNGIADVFVVQLASEPVNRITGTARSDRLIGTDSDDVIDGLAGHDRLKGDDGDDVLLGGRGHDQLDGGAGDDTLIGGEGIDKLTGGPGANLFVIDALSPAPDRILDFTPSKGDRLSLGPLIDSLGLRDAPDVNALVGARSIGKSIQITLDTNGADVRGGVNTVALLFRPEVTDPHQILEYVDSDTLVLDYGDYWG